MMDILKQIRVKPLLALLGEGAEEPHEQDAEGEDGDDDSGADGHLVIALLSYPILSYPMGQFTWRRS
jgi:hypothetical protein